VVFWQGATATTVKIEVFGTCFYRSLELYVDADADGCDTLMLRQPHTDKKIAGVGEAVKQDWCNKRPCSQKEPAEDQARKEGKDSGNLGANHNVGSSKTQC
jgi:hypothetical protein